MSTTPRECNVARKQTTRKTRQRRQSQQSVEGSDTAASRQAERQTYLDELREAVTAQRDAARTWLEDTHQQLNERLSQDADARQAYVTNLRQDTQAWLEQFRDDYDQKRHSDHETRMSYVETLQSDIQTQLNDFRADFADHMKTAQGDRYTFIDNMRQDTRAFLDDAQKMLQAQHQSDHNSRVTFLLQLRDDIEHSLTTFCQKLSEDAVNARQVRRDAFNEQIAAARAERARYYQRYRRHVDGAGVDADSVDAGSTGSGSSRKSTTKTSKTSKSKSRKSSRKSTTTSKQTTSSTADSSNTKKESVNDEASIPQEDAIEGMAAALLALVEQKPGSNAATLAEGLESIDGDANSVQSQLDSLVAEGKIKSRNRGYYLVVAPQNDEGANDSSEEDSST